MSRSKQEERSDSEDEEEYWEGEDDEEADDMVPGPPPDFYDPELDDKDAAWVHRQRGGRQSDAILSCPGCLTTVCLDCQQHFNKEGQFRAMFCTNVRVDKSKTVSSTIPSHRKGKRRRDDQDEAAQEEVFHPVNCDVCSAHLGVQDADGVFHLYHVVASNA